MISLEYLIWLNEAICQDSGEQSIIINRNNLLSALSVQQWYVEDSLLAAALIRSITIGHGFQDGNKRTAAAAGATICKFTCTDAEATECIMDIATGQLRDVQDITAKLYPDKYIRCSSSQLIANRDFNNWYMRLSQLERDKVDNLMEENHLDYNRASDIELSRIKSLYDDSHKSSEDILQEVERWAAGEQKASENSTSMEST